MKAEAFVPARLTQAREACGIALERAEATSLLPIGAFERGEQMPTREHLAFFSWSLGFPVAFFTSPIPAVSDEGTFHICERIEPCEECGEAAVAQCDYPTATGGTCDRYFCEQHRNRVEGFDDRDFCGEHMRATLAGDAAKKRPRKRRPIDEEAQPSLLAHVDPATTAEARASVRERIERLPKRV